MQSSEFKATDGDAYELQMGRWSRRLAERFVEFADVAVGDVVLDLGCGTGSLARTLAQRTTARQIRGVDFSPVYVEYARRQNTDTRVDFQVGDACALPFPEASFDRVLSLLMLHFVPQTDRAISEMRRVGRPGAIVAAAVWDARGGVVAHRMFSDTAAAIDARADAFRARQCTRPMSRPGELEAAWSRAGLQEISQTLLSIRMEFSCFEDYWGPYVGGQGPAAEYVAGLDTEPRVTLKEHVRRAYLDGEADGPRSYAASAWAVRGVVPR
ncbi:MAG: class I SAM-dependent methyltransferase [Proteobacteria bacterium]|nr:class I SAM-dependent methyltransferase [Pseudomonadota bacterium]MBI3497014.1 class I SAM-dependent methyltransferase [Pseudomonadota bacterium]